MEERREVPAAKLRSMRENEMNLLAAVENEMDPETKEAQTGDTRKEMAARTGYKVNANSSRDFSCVSRDRHRRASLRVFNAMNAEPGCHHQPPVQFGDCFMAR
jgi:hypothetical protein